MMTRHVVVATGFNREVACVRGLAGVVPVAGGVLVRDEAGRVIGAVGISGDTPDHDEACAVAGIAAAGLAFDTGAAH